MDTEREKKTGIAGKLARTLRNRNASRMSLRMTPMIDIIFLLLIFFLLTANFRPDESFLPLKMSAATAAQLPIAKAEPLIIAITDTDQGCDVRIGAEATVHIDNQNEDASMTMLEENIRRIMTRQKRNPSDPVEFLCQPQVKWQHLMKIYNTIFGMGISDITFQTTDDYYDPTE